MNQINETQARQALAEAKSQAASPKLYAARRETDGWSFSWADRSQPIPMGVRGVVVTDAGRVGRVRIGETAEQAIARLKA